MRLLFGVVFGLPNGAIGCRTGQRRSSVCYPPEAQAADPAFRIYAESSEASKRPNGILRPARNLVYKNWVPPKKLFQLKAWAETQVPSFLRPCSPLPSSPLHAAPQLPSSHALPSRYLAPTSLLTPSPAPAARRAQILDVNSTAPQRHRPIHSASSRLSARAFWM